MDQASNLPDVSPPKRRAKVVVGVGVVVLTLVGLVGWAMSRPGSTSFYMTPTELQAAGATAPQEELRVNGKVVPGSVTQDGIVTNFAITDGKTDVNVTTDQPLPDAFYSDTDRIEVVAQGDFDGRLFAASQVFAKCPSKFKAKA